MPTSLPRAPTPISCPAATAERARPLARLILAATLIAAPALAQTAPRTPPGDAAPSDLIPDSAMADPEHWALDTDAAHHAPDPRTLPDPDKLPVAEPDRTQKPAHEPEITLPEDFAVPPIVPLTPDPDIAGAVSAARDAGAALDVAMPRGGIRVLTGADAKSRDIGAGIALVVPRDADFPEFDELAVRFAPLSSLRTLGRGEDNLAQMSRRAHDDVAVLEQAMRVLGYYDAEISPEFVTLSPQATGTAGTAGTVSVRFAIEPGPRYRLAAVQLGDLGRSGDAPALSAAFGLKTGDPANTDRILSGKARLVAALGARGFAFAKVGEPALVVDHAADTADLALPVTTGGRYVFGTVTSSLPRTINARHLQRIARFRAGRPYDQRLVEDLKQALLSTGIIGGVTITPREAQAPAEPHPGIADIDVKLVRGPEHTVTAQAGYSSGQGIEIGGSWEDRNLFPPEGMVRVRTVLGTRQQMIGTTFRRSNFLARDTALNADLYAQVLNTDAYDAHTLSAIASLEKQSTLLFQKTWSWSLGLEAIATRELAAGSAPGTPFTPYFIGSLPLKLAYDGSNNLLDPVRGWRLSVSLAPSISIQNGPRSSYLVSQVDGSVYGHVSAAVVLAGRVRLGSISGTDIVNIAPSQRLYAGGGASIRGYAYQSVGPRDASGNPLGGRSLAEMSIEARIRTGLFAGDDKSGGLGVVPFLDGGTVGETGTPTFRAARFGAGIGVRYKTSFGPIRIDLGTPLNRRPGDSRIAVTIGLGQAF